MSEENIVVIGACGNLGKYFIEYLIKKIDLQHFKIIATGTRQQANFNKEKIEYKQLNITLPTDFEKLPQKNVKAVIDFAGVLPAYKANSDNDVYIDVNIKGTLNVLEYCRKVNAERIMYMQTWADLNGYLREGVPLQPYAPRKPIFTGDHAIYAISKCAAVDLIEHYHQQYGIRNYIFRLPNIYLYSPDKYYYVNGEKKLISYRYMIDKAIQGESIELWGNPNFGKDIVYVKDLCQMIYKSIFANVNSGTYNVGTGIKTTMFEQVQGIIKIFSPQNHPSEIIYRPDKPNCDDFVMDISNAIKDLGYEPEYTYIKYLEDYKKEMQKEER